MSKEAGERLEADLRTLRAQVSTLTRTIEQNRAESAEDRSNTSTKLQTLSRSFETTDKAARTNDADFANQLERMTHELAEVRGALEDSEHRLNENQVAIRDRLDAKLSVIEKTAQAEDERRKKVEAQSRFEPRHRRRSLRDAIDLSRSAASRDESRQLLSGLAARYPKERGMGDEAYFWLGKIALDEKQIEAALGYLIKVVDFRPTSRRAAEAYLLIGGASEASGQPEDAKTFYGEIVEHFGSTPQAKQARSRLAALKKARRGPAVDTTKASDAPQSNASADKKP